MPKIKKIFNVKVFIYINKYYSVVKSYFKKQFLRKLILMEFSTINESSLHKTLKVLYQEIYDGKTEVCQDGHIYDIVTKNGNIVEIQTKNLSRLLPKIQDTIEQGHNLKLVHPVIITNKIITYDQNGAILSSRKSPKKGSIYDIFREITGLIPVLLNPRFSLEIVEINLIEERQKTSEAVQSRNGRRRFKKDWVKVNKRLDEIINTRRFNKAEDYLALLPPDLPEEFCAKDIKKSLADNKMAPARISNNANLIVWVLHKMGVIDFTRKSGNTRYYKPQITQIFTD